MLINTAYDDSTIHKLNLCLSTNLIVLEMSFNILNVNKLFKPMKLNALYGKAPVRSTYGENVAYLMELSLCNKHFKEFMKIFWCKIHALAFDIFAYENLGLYKRIANILTNNDGNTVDTKTWL